MRFYLILLFSVLHYGLISQSNIVVNPDGTHSVQHRTGNISTTINPNGTHSVTHHFGNSSTQINPDGTHTIIHHSENSSTQINPDGTHTVIHHFSNSSTQINPDGTHSSISHYDQKSNSNTASAEYPNTHDGDNFQKDDQDGKKGFFKKLLSYSAFVLIVIASRFAL